MNKPIRNFSLIAAAVFAATSTLGAADRVLVPPEIIQTVPAGYPVSLEDSTIPDGDVNLVITVSADGQLTDALVLGYTHKAFASQALSALGSWSYKAATLDGRPIGARVTLKMHFSTATRAVTLLAIDTLASMIHKPAQFTSREFLAEPSDLDQPLELLHAEQPRLSGPPESGPEGTTTIEFYVDTKGRPRVPVVLKSTDPAFAEAAVRALDSWQFAVPMRGGEPVIVRTQQEFVFKNDT